MAPAVADTVALMSADLKGDDPDRFFPSVNVAGRGRFEFAHVRPGYVLGRLAFTLNGERISATY